MNRSLKSFFLCACAALCASLILASCAPQVIEAPKELVWPLPPDKPRIKFIAMYYGSRDVEKKSSFLDTLLGEETGVGMLRPQGITGDLKGNIYVSDSAMNVVDVFDFVRSKYRFIGQGAQEQTSTPIGLAVDNKSNTLLVASASSRKVIGYDADSGNVRFVIGQEPGFFKNPAGVAVDDERGRIYVTDSKLSELRVFDNTGRYLSTIAKGGGADNQLHTPSQVFVDRQGRVYVADAFNFKIKIFGPDGAFIRAVGYGHGDAPGYFSRVYGVAVDSEGHIYAADADFCNIQIFDQEGRLLMAFGSVGNSPGLFVAPMHMWIDRNDRIYVADSLNNRIQVFQYLKEQ